MQAILIADDHPLFRAALAGTLRQIQPECEVHEAGDMDQTRQSLECCADIDLVLLDLHMPGSYGFGGLLSLRNAHPTVATVMITANENPATVRRALEFGAQGYIPKRATPEEIAEALAVVDRGEVWHPPLARDGGEESAARPREVTLLARLTPQQHRVLERVAEGMLNKQIADRLNVSERTVKAHVSAILEKLEVLNRTQAGMLLRQLAVVDPDQDLPPD